MLPERGEAVSTVQRLQVGARFFETLGIRIVRGRPLDERDATGGPGAVVVSEAFVARHWPGADPLGRVLRLPDLATLIGGAVHLPYPRLDERSLANYPADTLFVVYCNGPHCNGADRAAARLARLGRYVKRMIGGIEGWKDIGFALETDE